MTLFSELYEQLSDKEKTFFGETLNLLLARNYLVYEREQDRPHYRFVEKHLELFRRYLEMARWSIHQVKQYEVIQLYNMDERNRRPFTLQETIMLFILRLLYDEKAGDLRLTDQVIISGQDIQEKYLALQVKNRLPAREDLQRILKLFSSFALLDLKKGQWKDPEAVFVLYRSLLLVMNSSDLDDLAQWLNEQAGAPENDAEEEPADEEGGWEETAAAAGDRLNDPPESPPAGAGAPENGSTKEVDSPGASADKD